MSKALGTSQGYERTEPNVRLIAAVGGVSIFLLFASVLGLQFYFDRALEQQVYVKVLEPESQALRDLRAREDSELHSYRYLDRAKGTVRLPIERAMELQASEAAHVPK